jgi:hypothetical protein
MLTREHKRASTLRRLGTLTAVLVTSSLLFGTLPASAASAPAAPPASAAAQALALPSTVRAAAAKPLTTTPTPKITGDLKVGATLTAVRGTWQPSPVALSYSWLVGKVAKGTAATYKITAADVGKTVMVKVTGKKTGYTTVTKTSAATAAIVGTLTAAPTPTISGTVKIGSTLTAKPGTWGPAPVALTYAWSVGGVAKATTGTYKIAAADAGKTITVKVTGKKAGYTNVAKSSAATAKVPAVVGTLTPAPTPIITGTLKVGSTLTATPGTWGPAPVALTYAWTVGGVAKATTGTYKIAAADAGKTIVVSVTGKKTGYTTLTKTSAATAIVPAAVGTLTPAPTPTITGTVKVGSTLTAVPGTWGPAPVTLAYSWTVGGVAAATTATYKIAPGDTGKTIALKITASKAGYTTLSKSSAATVAVPAVLGTLSPAPAPTITGEIKIGSPLTAVPGTWGPSPVTLSYSWIVGGEAKATTPGYTVTTADAGKAITVKVTGTKTGYATLSKTSTATAVVPAADAPVRITADITTDTTWSLAKTYLIEGNISVAKGKTLTIPAGAIVKFSYYGNLTVNGSVKIGGTSAKHVVFTSVNDDAIGGDTNGDDGDSIPALDDWNGIQVEPGANLTATYLDTRFTSSGISSSDAGDLTVTDSALSGGVEASRSAGSAYAGRKIVIQRNTVADGAVQVASDNNSATAVAIMITDNTITGSSSFAVEVSDIQLRPSNLTGNTATGNTINAMALVGTLVEDWSMPVDAIPIVIRDYSVSFERDLMVAKGKTLTIPAGLVVKFDHWAELSVAGSVKINGTAAKPVVFTSLYDDAVGGDTNGDGDDSAPEVDAWHGVTVAPGATATVTYLDARHTGRGLFSSDASEFSVTDSTVSGGVGAYRSAGSEFAGRKITILRNTVTDGSIVAMSDNSSASAVPMKVSGNAVSGADAYAVQVSDLQLRPSNLTGNTAANGTINAMALAGTLVEDWTMPVGAIPVVLYYYAYGYSDVHNLTIAKGKTLTVPAGVVVKLDTEAQLIVDGVLKVAGTAANPVVFTSLADDTVGGDTSTDGDDTDPQSNRWSGVTVNAGATMTAAYLDSRFSHSGVSSSDAGELTVADSALSGGITAHRSEGSEHAARKISILRNTVTDGAVQVSSENASASAVPIQVSGNTVSGSTGYALQVSDMQLRPSKLTGNTATDNTINALALTGTLVEDWSMPANAIPIVFRYYGDWVNQDFTVAVGKTLTVPAGIVLKFDGGALVVNGALKIAGTAAKPVVFTSLLDDTIGGDTNGDGDDSYPEAGDWSGIQVDLFKSFSATNFESRYSAYDITFGDRD